MKATEPIVDASTLEKVKDEKKRNVADQRELNMPRNQYRIRSESQAKSRPRSQRDPRTHHLCHYCGLQEHNRPSCHKLRALNNASNPSSRGPRIDKRSRGGEQSRSQDGNPRMMDVMKMIGAFTTCLESFSRRFESFNSCTQFHRDITPNTRDVWVKRGTHA